MRARVYRAATVPLPAQRDGFARRDWRCAREPSRISALTREAPLAASDDRSSSHARVGDRASHACAVELTRIVPQELLQAIIDALWIDSADDEDGAIECWTTLRSATLVSRRWHAVAQRRFEGLLPSCSIAETWYEEMGARRMLDTRGRLVRVLYAVDDKSGASDACSLRVCSSVVHVAAWGYGSLDSTSSWRAVRDLRLHLADVETLRTLPMCPLRHLKVVHCDFEFEDDVDSLAGIQLPSLICANLEVLDIGVPDYAVNICFEAFLRQFTALKRFKLGHVDSDELLIAFQDSHRCSTSSIGPFDSTAQATPTPSPARHPVC